MNYEGVTLMDHADLLLFGERIRYKRNHLGFTQEYVAEKLDISLRFYQMIERGEKSVSLETLTGLGRVLNVSVDYLLFGDQAQQLDSPVASIFRQLTPRQRDDAAQILRLYLDACNDVPGKDK